MWLQTLYVSKTKYGNFRAQRKIVSHNMVKGQFTYCRYPPFYMPNNIRRVVKA